jgi:hypothetical protein
MHIAFAAVHESGCDAVRSVAQFSLDDQTLDDVDRRRHVFVALPVRLQLHIAADSIELALQIVDAPAIEGERRDMVLPVDLSDPVRNSLRIGRRSDRHNPAEL